MPKPPISVLIDALARDIAEEDRNALAKPLPEAQVATLREVAARYTAPCPFKVGDIVTAKAGYNTAGEGDPHIVLEIAGVPVRNFETGDDPRNSSSMAFGRRMDMRVACFVDADGSINAFWVESWIFEPFVAEGGV